MFLNYAEKYRKTFWTRNLMKEGHNKESHQMHNDGFYQPDANLFPIFGRHPI